MSLFFLSCYILDVMLSPASAVTWRSIGGVLDFWVFTGPTPEMVIAQYTEVCPNLVPVTPARTIPDLQKTEDLITTELMVKNWSGF